MIVTADGLVLVGASKANVDSVADAGAAYVFSVNVSTWVVMPVGGALSRSGNPYTPMMVVLDGFESVTFPAEFICLFVAFRRNRRLCLI